MSLNQPSDNLRSADFLRHSSIEGCLEVWWKADPKCLVFVDRLSAPAPDMLLGHTKRYIKLLPVVCQIFRKPTPFQISIT